MTNKKNIVWNIIGSTANAFTSLIFTIIVTRINGVFDAGVFTYCFATSCLFYMIASYSGRTFQVTDISNKFSDTDYIFHRIITCIIMILFTLLFCFYKKYDNFKSLILFLLALYKCIEAFSESLYGVIQKNNMLYKVGISMFLKASLSVIMFLIIDMFSKNLLLSSISILLINIIFLIFYDFKNLYHIKFLKTKLNLSIIKKMFIVGFSTFILLFLGNYLINTSRYAIDDLLTSDFQTIFGVIIMPATFMGLLGQYIIQPFLVSISEFIKKQEYKKLKDIICKLILFILGIGSFVVIVAYFLEVPVLEIVYGLELSEYLTEMIIVIIGSIFYGLSFILSSILIAMRKTKIQVVIYSIFSVLSTIMAYILVKEYGIFGSCINYFITMFGISILFLICIIYNMKLYKKIWLSEKV